MAREDDPLLLGLAGGDSADREAPSELRDAIYRRTARIVRARRWRKRLALAAAAVLLFAAGVLTGSRFLPFPGGEGAEEAPLVARRPPEPAAIEARLRAARPEDRPEILRRAGDGYLRGDVPDPESALRCYRQLLEERPENAVASADDSWLLLYLKLSRDQENPK
jgi:hypothetical protein